MIDRDDEDIRTRLWIDVNGSVFDIYRSDDPHNYRRATWSMDALKKIVIPPREYMLQGLILENSITIINGARGSGKSWLAFMIANEVSWGGQVGPWKVSYPAPTYLVDGEMQIELIQERAIACDRGRDEAERPCPMYLYSEAIACEVGLKRASILDPVWREAVIEDIKEKEIRLVILDNLASLAPGIDENEKMEFDPVNRWLLELRFAGISVIMIHHVGISGRQRGTTAHEDHVDTALLIKDMGSKSKCCFKVTVTKDRAGIIEGDQWILELLDDKKHKAWFDSYDVDEKKEREKSKEESKIFEFIEKHPNMSQRQIADKLGIGLGTVNRYVQRSKNT